MTDATMVLPDHPTPERDPISTMDTSSSSTANGAAPTSAAGDASTSSQRPIQQQQRQYVHQQTGYRWTKEEDAPGYSWKNRKAQEEIVRAMEAIVDKDRTVGRKYGDIGSQEFEAGSNVS